MPNIVLIRHGQSKWNLENKFTGWKDIDLSENGVNEAIEAGRLIKKHALIFDVAFASVLPSVVQVSELSVTVPEIVNVLLSVTLK